MNVFAIHKHEFLVSDRHEVEMLFQRFHHLGSGVHSAGLASCRYRPLLSVDGHERECGRRRRAERSDTDAELGFDLVEVDHSVRCSSDGVRE